MIYHDNSADILGIAVIPTSTSFRILVDVTVSGPAIVFCGLFPFSNSSVNISTTRIQFQNNVNATLSNKTRVTMNGVDNCVRHELFCMTTTIDGLYSMALANILNTKTVIAPETRRCNSTVSVPIQSRTLIHSNLMEKVFSVNIENLYFAEDVVMSINVSHVNSNQDASTSGCVATDVVVHPEVIAVSGRNNRDNKKEKVDVYLGTLCPGIFQIEILPYSSKDFFDGNSSTSISYVLPSIDDVVFLYPNGRTIEFVTSADNFPSPAAIGASFIGSRNEIVVTFDIHTNFGDLGYRLFDCSMLLSFSGASSSKCFWSDSLHLVIMLNSASTILPGDVVTVKSGEITSRETSPVLNLSTSRRSLSTENVVVVTTNEETYPEIIVHAPLKLPSCMPFTLDLTESVGFIGRNWENVTVVVKSDSVAGLEEVSSFYRQHYDIYDATTLPGGSLQPGYFYVFDIYVCNCLMNCAQASHVVTVTPTYAPFFTNHWDMSVKRSVRRVDETIITSGYEQHNCDTQLHVDIVSISHDWKVFNEIVMLGMTESEPIFVTMSNESRPLAIPPYFFPSTSFYEVIEELTIVTLSAGDNSTTNFTFQNIFLVEVLRSPVVAVVSPSRNVSVAINETKLLDGSFSYQSDNEFDEGHHLRYDWSCVRLGPLTPDHLETDCGGFLLVDSSTRSLARVNPMFIGGFTGALVNSVFSISLFVQWDNLEHDDVEVIVTVSSLPGVLINFGVGGQYNTGDDFKVSATLSSPVKGNVSWSIEGVEGSILSDVALTYTRVEYKSAPFSQEVYLMLRPFVLRPGISYTVQLNFFPQDPLIMETTYSAIVVVPNSVPLPGIFSVFPLAGLSLLDNFTFHARLWSSDQLPLLYSFGFKSVSSGIAILLSSPGTSTKLTTLLPEGNSFLGSYLECVLHVFDAIGSLREETVHVKVTPRHVSNNEMINLVDNVVLGDSLGFYRSFGPVLETLTKVNCSVAPDCHGIGRLNCSIVAQTCGECMKDFVGEKGHHNSRCVRKSLLLMDTQTSTCSDDNECALFEICLSGKCATDVKQCPADCSSHGFCGFVTSSTGTVITGEPCLVGQTHCSPKCFCDSQWFGIDCSRSESDMIPHTAVFKDTMCLFSENVITSSGASRETVSAWVNELTILTLDATLLTHDASICFLTAVEYIFDLISKSTATFRFDTIQAIVDATAMVLEYHDYFDYHNQTTLQKVERLNTIKSLLQTYCVVISGKMVPHQLPRESDKTRLRAMSTFLENSGRILTELSFTATKQEAYNSVPIPTIEFIPPTSGGWCLFQFDAIVYSDFGDESLKANTLSVMSSNVTDTMNYSSFDGEYLSLTLLNVAENYSSTSFQRATHSVSCSPSEFGNYLNHSCPHSESHMLFCDDKSIGAWEITCPAWNMSVACKAFKVKSSSLSFDETGCEVISISDSSVVCQCPMMSLLTPVVNLRGRALNEDDHMVNTEFTAVLVYSVEDFVAQWIAVDGSLNGSNDVMYCLGFLIFLLIGGLYYSDVADRRYEAGVAEMSVKNGRTLPHREGRREDSRVTVDLDYLFPVICTNDPFIFKFSKIAKRSHRWASLFYYYKKDSPRSLRYISCFSAVVCSIFFISILYNLADDYENKCELIYSEKECASGQYGMFWEDRCIWDRRDGDGRCRLENPKDSMTTVIVVAILAAVFSLPFAFVVEYITYEVLCRPTAAPLRSTCPKPIGPLVTYHDNRASAACVELKKLLNELYEHFRYVTVKNRMELESLWGMTYLQVEGYLKESPTLSHSFDQDITVSHHRRSSLLCRKVAFLFHAEDVTPFERLLTDIMDVLSSTMDESARLAAMSKKEQGVHLLVLFQKDLLESIAAEIVERKSIRGKTVQRKAVSKTTKLCGFAFILLFDMALLFYTFLFAVEQDQSLQTAWVLSFVIWAFLDLFVVNTVVVFLSEYLTPYLVYTEAEGVRKQMIHTVHDYQTRLLSGSSASDCDLRKSHFNVAPYLMVSHRLSSLLPHSIESHIIRNFQAVAPKHPYAVVKKEPPGRIASLLSITSGWVRWSLLQVFGLVSLSHPCIEYCVNAFIAWVAIGYFVIWQAKVFNDKPMLAIMIYLPIVVVVFVIFVFCCVYSSIHDEKHSEGLINIQTAPDEGKDESKSHLDMSIDDKGPDIVQKYGRIAMVTRSLQKFPQNKNRIVRLRADGVERTQVQTAKLLMSKTSRGYNRSEVGLNFDLSSSSDENILEEEGTQPVSFIANFVRNHRSSLAGIWRRRQAAPKLKKRLDRDMHLGVNLSDCSDDSYPDRVSSNSEMEGDGNLDDKFLLSSDSSSDNDCEEAFQDKDIRSERSESDSSRRDENKSTSDESCGELARKYGKIFIDERPAVASKIRAHGGALKRIAAKRRVEKELRLECSVSTSDSDQDDMFSLSSDNGSYDEISEGSEITMNSEDDGTQMTASQRTSLKRRIVSDVFGASKDRKSLVQRIRKNRDGIRKVGLRRRAQGIEDAFVVNTRARRVSAIANRNRAQAHLRKRIEQRKAAGTKEDDLSTAQPVVSSSRKRSRRRSYEMFTEKKRMVKKLAAHNTLLEHSLETKRQEAKEALKARLTNKKKS